MTSVDSPTAEEKKIKHKRHSIGSKTKTNFIFKSRLVQSIRDSNANLTRIYEFELEDMKNRDQTDVF